MRTEPHMIKMGRGISDVPLVLAQRILDWCIDITNDFNTPCWIWQGYCDKDGYAEIKFRGKKYRAARISYVAFIGPINNGNDIDHTCKNRACVNPKHLQQTDPLTNRVKLRDEREKDDVPF